MRNVLSRMSIHSRLGMVTDWPMTWRWLGKALLVFLLAGNLLSACNPPGPAPQPSPTVSPEQPPTGTVRLLPDLLIREVHVISDAPDGCLALGQNLRTIVQIEN